MSVGFMGGIGVGERVLGAEVGTGVGGIVGSQIGGSI